MVLVDTSVMIDYLRGQENHKTMLFQAVLDNDIDYAITDVVYLELLQGSRDPAAFRKLREYLSGIPRYPVSRGQDSLEEAARLVMRCQSRGVSVRSTLDVLIAMTAIENHLYLLHNNRDFDTIASVADGLKILHRFETD